jgi:putative acyl-CoA dehydrogenase
VEQAQARVLTGRLALLLQSALMLRDASGDAAALFCTSRLSGQHGRAFGTLPADANMGLLLDRAFTA